MKDPSIHHISKKVCLLGSLAVGKTSLVRRAVYDLFDDRYLSTIGVKVSRKSILLPNTTRTPMHEVTLLLWDLGSDEGNGIATASYLGGAAGAILVCDMTRRTTLDALREYKAALEQVSPRARIVCAANKSDLADLHEFSTREFRSISAELGDAALVTSAKTGEDVEQLFIILGRLLVEGEHGDV